MKALLIAAIAVASAAPAVAQRAVRVGGHVTNNGVYVPPHYRSAPDSTRLNNWSTSPNVNPYTGKVGTQPAYKPYTYNPYRPK